MFSSYLLKIAVMMIIIIIIFYTFSLSVCLSVCLSIYLYIFSISQLYNFTLINTNFKMDSQANVTMYMYNKYK